MPNDTITKAIKRGTGELGDLIIEELNYEGYGPGGGAVLVECQTDNKNRTTAEVRHVFTKFNGNLGANGCVSYLFERKGMVVLDGERCDLEAAMDAAIEAGAEDVEEDGGVISVTTAMEDLHSVSAALTDAGQKWLVRTSDEIRHHPWSPVRVIVTAETLDLAAERADQVATYLATALILPREQVETQSVQKLDLRAEMDGSVAVVIEHVND